MDVLVRSRTSGSSAGSASAGGRELLTGLTESGQGDIAPESLQRLVQRDSAHLAGHGHADRNRRSNAEVVTDGAVEVLLDFVDDEGDGRIQYDEFSAMLMAEDVMEMRPENRGKEKKAIYVRPGGGAQIASQIEGARQPGAIDPRDGQY